jgi:hypothetical protein
VDSIIVLTNGKISESGTYDELLDHAGPFAEFLETYLVGAEEGDVEGVDFMFHFSAKHFSSSTPQICLLCVLHTD